MTSEAVDQLIDSLRHRPVATTAAQMREAAELITKQRTALKEISAMRGMTLLGGRDLEPDKAHELGAHKAFNQAADVAEEALK